MKNYRKMLFSGFVVSLIGIAILILSYVNSSVLQFVMGILCVLTGILLIILLVSFNLFIQDKTLNIEKLKEMGLTIVVCKVCLKENVLEDQYCIYCGERLGSDEDGIQEEHKT